MNIIIMKDFIFDDGGRSKYFSGDKVGDCVTRAIAIATGEDYRTIYVAMSEGMAKLGKPKSARLGVSKKVYHKFLLDNGFKWVPTMFIGQGCKVHLHREELPNGILIVRLSKHLTCVKEGIIYDTYNPQRGSITGTTKGIAYSLKESRCVYGYYIKEN